MRIIFYLLFLLGVFLEGTITTLPLTLVFLIAFTILKRKRDNSIFLVAFLSGLFLDILTLRTLGVTSLFYLALSFVVLMYERKYEIATIPFIAVASFVGSVIYLLVFSESQVVQQAFTASMIAVVLLLGILLFRRRELPKKY